MALMSSALSASSFLVSCTLASKRVWLRLRKSTVTSGCDRTLAAPSTSNSSERPFLLSLVFFTCLALFVTKAFIAHRDLREWPLPPRVWSGQVLATLGRVWVCCAEDFAVGLGCLLVSMMAFRVSY